jgi:hypothetical protein
MSLASRIGQMERKHSPGGKWHCFLVSGRDELEAKKAELRGSPDFNPEDTVVFFVITDDPNAELVVSTDD